MRRTCVVVGVMTVWFDPKMEGEDSLEAGGEDAAAAIEAMTASGRDKP